MVERAEASTGPIATPSVDLVPADFAESLAIEMLRLSTLGSAAARRSVAAVRKAKTMPEIAAIHATFIRESLEYQADFSRKLSELLVPSKDQDRRQAKGHAPSGTSPLASRFAALVSEAETGQTDVITGLSASQRRKMLFDVET